MKLQFLLFNLLSTFFVFSQENVNVSIDWSQQYEPSIKNTIWVGNNIFQQNGFVPQYSRQGKKETQGAVDNDVFSNVVTKRIELNALGGVDVLLLPSAFNPSLNIVKERNVEYLSIGANAMYKDNNGAVIQVQSFQVSYSLNSFAKTSRVARNNTVINSVLSSGTFYKIAIDKTGVFKIDAAFLKSIGINIATINPRQIKVYGNGGAMLPELLSQPRKNDLEENAIYVFGENDNVFNDDDYVLFYAQGPISWQLNSRDDISHKQNIYSKYGYYFISVDSGTNGKRIRNAAIVNNATTANINTFTDYLLHEKELYNYLRTGRKWFGENFTVNNSQNFIFNFPNIDVSKEVNVQGNFSAHSTSMSTLYTVSDGTSFMNTTINRSGSSGFMDNLGETSFIPKNDNVALNVLWTNSGDLSATAYLDYLQVTADRFLIADGKQFGFTNFNSMNTGEVLEYTLSNDTNIDFIWNVTDNTTPTQLVDSDKGSTNFKFKEITDGELNKYQVVKVSDAYLPIKLSNGTNIQNQNLHALKDIQYIIITKSNLISEANRMRDYHRNNTTISETNTAKINVEVVDVDKIYNEFGSGAPDITAIRDFAKYLYDNASSDDTRLKYICLFGDASFDFKGITYSMETQIIPTYISTVSNSLSGSYNSDDYYGFMDASDDTRDDGELEVSGKLDIVTGRIPVGTSTKANQYVNKLLNYYSTRSFGAWKNKITLLADDGQDGSDQSLTRYLENSSLKIEANDPDLNISKLYADAKLGSKSGLEVAES